MVLVICPWPIRTSPRSPEICKAPAVCSVTRWRPRPSSRASLCDVGPCSQQLGTTSLDLGKRRKPQAPHAMMSQKNSQSDSGLSPEVWGKEVVLLMYHGGVRQFFQFVHTSENQTKKVSTQYEGTAAHSAETLHLKAFSSGQRACTQLSPADDLTVLDAN